MAVGSRSLRERKKARTREALIAAAIELFESRGYEGTTIDDIAAAADVSPRTFFRYFASKEEVAVGDDLDPMLMQMIAGRPAGESVIESARQVAVQGLALMSPEDWAALLARLKLVYNTPALRARRWEHQLELRRRSGALLAERRGLPPDDLGSRVTAAAALTAVEIAIDLWQEHDGREDLTELMIAAISRLADAFEG